MRRLFLGLRKSTCVVLGLLVLLSCKRENLESPSCTPYVPPLPTDTYIFPVQPGTPAWAALQSGADMIAVCQVPTNVLKSISTPGLVTTCLNYPLLSNMVAFTPLQKGTRAQLTNFNGFGELSQRSDAATLLASRYQLMQTACLPTPAEWGDYSFTYSYLEMVLAQDEYLNQLSSGQRHALVKEALAKYAAKQKLITDVYGVFGLKTTAFLMARVMQAEQYGPLSAAISVEPDLRAFVRDAEIYGNQSLLDEVVTNAKNFN
jgi:hypothetical protein